MKRCQLEEHMAASATVHFIPLLGMVTGLTEKVETLQATIVALQEQVATHQQHAAQEQTHGRQAVELQGKVTTLEEKGRELDVSVKDLFSVASPAR